MDISTTRRALLGAGMAIAVTAPPAVASNATSRGRAYGPTVASPQFVAMITAAQEAERACSEHHRQVYTPAADLMNQAVAQAEASYPHVTVNAGPSMGGGEVVWSTGKPPSVAVVQSIVKMAREGKDMTAAGIIPARKLYAAHLWRTRAIDRARNKWGVSAIADESNRLCDLAAEAASAVAGHPISTAADLRAKLQFMTDQQMGDGMDWLSELLADAERIAAKEDRA